MNKQFKKAILLGILVLIFVAFLDIKAAQSGLFGSLPEYTNGDYTRGWWDLFQWIVLVSFAFVPICYYFFYKKDKSEAIAIYLTSYIMWISGLADIFYFWLQGVAIPETLPWLINHPTMSKIAEFINVPTITPLVLIISVSIGFIAVMGLTKYMEKI